MRPIILLLRLNQSCRQSEMMPNTEGSNVRALPIPTLELVFKHSSESFKCLFLSLLIYNINLKCSQLDSIIQDYEVMHRLFELELVYQHLQTNVGDSSPACNTGSDFSSLYNWKLQ